MQRSEQQPKQHRPWMRKADGSIRYLSTNPELALALLTAHPRASQGYRQTVHLGP